MLQSNLWEGVKKVRGKHLNYSITSNNIMLSSVFIEDYNILPLINWSFQHNQLLLLHCCLWYFMSFSLSVQLVTVHFQTPYFQQLYFFLLSIFWRNLDSSCKFSVVSVVMIIWNGYSLCWIFVCHSLIAAMVFSSSNMRK